MKKYITDEIYCNSDNERSLEVISVEKRLCRKLISLIPEADYMKVEEELIAYGIMLEKEAFYYGFLEGIRFLIKCM